MPEDLALTKLGSGRCTHATIVKHRHTLFVGWSSWLAETVASHWPVSARPYARPSIVRSRHVDNCTSVTATLARSVCAIPWSQRPLTL